MKTKNELQEEILDLNNKIVETQLAHSKSLGEIQAERERSRAVVLAYQEYTQAVKVQEASVRRMEWARLGVARLSKSIHNMLFAEKA